MQYGASEFDHPESVTIVEREGAVVVYVTAAGGAVHRYEVTARHDGPGVTLSTENGPTR